MERTNSSQERHKEAYLFDWLVRGLAHAFRNDNIATTAAQYLRVCSRHSSYFYPTPTGRRWTLFENPQITSSLLFSRRYRGDNDECIRRNVLFGDLFFPLQSGQNVVSFLSDFFKRFLLKITFTYLCLPRYKIRTLYLFFSIRFRIPLLYFSFSRN